MRLIDADELTIKLKRLLKDFAKAPTKQYVIRIILSMLGDKTQTPTIDAEPVVRCKDCEHWKQEKSHTGNSGASFCKCGWFSSYQNVDGGIYTSRDDYCSYGTKTDEGVTK